MRRPVFPELTDERIVIVLIGIAVFWRAVVSFDETEAPWECCCSGISLFILGWALFGYLYSLSQKPTSWPISNTIYQGIGFSLFVLNSYVMIYYGLRWYGLLQVEVFPPLDLILRNVRYVTFVMFYCAILWSTKYLETIHEEYQFLLARSTLHERSLRASVFKVLTDDRTLLVMIGIAFLWRTVISFDYTITFWESTCQYITQLIIGWFLFGHICALAVKAREKPDLIKVTQGIALALSTINVYALVYYGLSWYSLVGLVEYFEVVFVPADCIFQDLRFFSLVIFYYTMIVLSKFLETACTDYTVPDRAKHPKLNANL
ncbi:MAG TPA: hypothetical protein VMW67_06570 [Desulfobacteria bacterium]|nr:hypothetical protein [Desulfobacteria bacterium]